jgi:hypothetical protein
MPVEIPESEKPCYITVYESISGWKAVMLWWAPEMGGFWEPWTTGVGAYGTEAEAEVEGKQWASEEGLEFRKRGECP